MCPPSFHRLTAKTMNQTGLVILLIFGCFASSRCLDNNVDDEEINSSLSLKIFNDNLTSLMFRDSNPVRLRDGRTIKELTCVENCMVRVDRVNCSRRADSLVWRCVSPSLQRSSYCFDNTFIVCDNLESADESSGRGIGETGCYMHYSLKTKDADEFDFSLLLVVLVCFVTIALFVELLKRWFDCQSKCRLIDEFIQIFRIV